ncbi:hypothetical protein EIN_028380, partial [Entamoeba invadens IP1]
WNEFVKQYTSNTTDKCIKSFTPNNVLSEIALVYGIADKSIIKDVQNSFSSFSELKTAPKTTIYYLKGEAFATQTVNTKDLNYELLSSIEASSGKVDALVIAAKRYLEPKVKDKSIKRGTILVLSDQGLSRVFNAGSEFDRNNISVHVVSFNRQNSASMTLQLKSLVSLGQHFHEFNDPKEVKTNIYDAFVGIRANLTERCDRDKCNGFCDAKNRCTCPMCCENDCFYTYCNTNSGSCEPWPPYNPKEKVTCPSNCVGDYICKDMEGCVVSRYNTSCEPKVDCQTTTCPNGDSGLCQIVDNCPLDDSPSQDGYCWSYKCDVNSGYCIKDQRGKEKCPNKNSKCEQYKCNANLECSVEPKECVKTMPYIEMDCYIAKCNEKTGQCENRLSCDTFSSCGGGASGESICYCNATTNNKCFCEKKEGDNNCDSNKNEICDYTQDPPKCVVSRCKEDLTISGCQYQKCNETTGNAYYVDIECTETIKEVDSRCKDMFTYICMDGKCVVKAVVSEDELKVECGYCEYNSVSNSVVYISNCEKTQAECDLLKEMHRRKCVYPQV